MTETKDKICLYLALISPCIPKIGITPQITVFPAEFFWVLFSFYYISNYIKFKIQKYLLNIFGLFLLFTIVSFFYFEISIASLLRCIKEIAYIPLVFIAYKSKWLQWKQLCYIFVVAVGINIMFYFQKGINLSSFSIWDTESLFNGLSGKYFDLQSFSIVNMPRGSHGIWTIYCILAFVIAIFSYENKQISTIIFVICFILCVISVSFSVSREGLIVLLAVLVCYMYAKIISKSGSSILYIFILIGIILIGVYLVTLYGNNLAIVKKINYTQESIVNTGEEGNIQLRINGWIVYFKVLLSNPMMTIVGFGFNFNNYISYIDFSVPFRYATIPESFFVECLMCGGITALYFGILFWREFYKYANSIKNRTIKYAVIGLWYGTLFGAIFSGAAIISDMLFGYLLIFLGILLRYNETNTTDYSQIVSRRG
ncbi:MAG: hypothetical protein IKP73_06555 [Bacteroidales bacterium]|nr:hypothetical protein [Bacteroidales bacterium]